MTRLTKQQFGRLVKEHHPAVYRSARRIVRDDATAADITQDVFVRALRGKVRFEQARDEGATLCWLAARLAQNALRGRRRRQQHEENAVSLPSPSKSSAHDPAESVADRDLQHAVQHCVDELPDDLRVPLQLHCQDDWTLAAVGSALQLSTSTVHDRVQRAIEKLRAMLTGRGFALTGVAMPELLRQAPAPVVPVGLEATLLAAGQGATMVAVGTARRALLAATLAIGAVGVAVAADAFGGGGDPSPAEVANAGALVDEREQDPQPAAPERRPAESARVAASTPAADVTELLDNLAGSDNQPAAVAPPRFVTFKGTVHDAKAWPVVGARVVANAAGGLKAFSLGSGVTNHLGAFSFEVNVGRFNLRSIRLSVWEGSNKVLGTDEIKVPKEQAPPPVALVLDEEVGAATDRFEWSIFAHDEAGHALPGVEVSSYPAPLAKPGEVAGFRDAIGKTGADGKVVLRGRKLGDRWLFVDGREVGRGYSFTKVSLARGGSHERSVLVAGGKSLRVNLAHVDGRSMKWTRAWLRDERLGVYIGSKRGKSVQFDGLMGGPYTVYAAAMGCSNSALREVAGGAGEVRIRLKDADDLRDVGDHMAELHGAIYDAATGEKVAAYQFDIEELEMRDGESTLAADRLIPPRPVQTMVDEPRKVVGFDIGGLEPGRRALAVAVDGYAQQVYEFDAQPSEMRTDVRIELHRGGSARGRLVDRAGRPLAKRRVFIIGVGELADRLVDKWRTHKRGGRRSWRAPPTSWHRCGATTDEQGNFVLKHVPPGVDLRVIAQSQGGGVGLLDLPALRNGEQRTGLLLQVEK